MKLYDNAYRERIIIGILWRMMLHENQESPILPAEPIATSIEPVSRIGKKQAWRSLRWPLIFLGVIWALHFFSLKEMNGPSWGIHPRQWAGLTGILTAPFIHADYDHLISNSLPLLVVGTVLFHFYRAIAWQVISMIWLLTGFWVWLLARPSTHIGASGLIYGGVIFLFFSGIFRKDMRLMAISFLVVFLYGSLAWGILPLIPDQSWESHLFGSIAGLFSAIYFRKEGPQRKKFQWELEEEQEKSNPVTDDDLAGNLTEEPEQKIVVQYDYRPAEKNSQKGK